MVREGWQGVSIGCLVSNKKQYSTEICVLQIRYFIFYETTNKLEMISWKWIFRIWFSFGSLELHFQLWYIVPAPVALYMAHFRLVLASCRRMLHVPIIRTPTTCLYSPLRTHCLDTNRNVTLVLSICPSKGFIQRYLIGPVEPTRKHYHRLISSWGWNLLRIPL
jgi:hypothetical protein